MKRVSRAYEWKDGKRLRLGERTLVMGILNVTPDSFSDGGMWNTPEKALARALEMEAEGADIIDVGAESSRPGSVPISAEEEAERLAPFLRVLLPAVRVPISVDTYKAATADMAAQMGAHIINDIWGLQYAPEPGKMAEAAAAYSLPVVVMHNRENPDGRNDIISSLKKFFEKSVKIANDAGIEAEKLILDPGIGFGKTPEENLRLIGRLDELSDIGGKAYPILLGASRKSFIGAALGLSPGERVEATGAACVLAAAKGCGIVRVHDVKPIARMCRMADAIIENEREEAS